MDAPAAAAGLKRYFAPAWASSCKWLDASRPTWLLPGIANLPTPIVRWHLSEDLLPAGFRLWIKRDDISGCELSGNKVRKLQFLLADAKLKDADCLVTAGGEQTNHGRATALAACSVGLETHLVLRTNAQPEKLGLVGNVLLDRLAGAKLHLASKKDWAVRGSSQLVKDVAQMLREQGRSPYEVPVGGSNGLGTWGHLDAVGELEQQLHHGAEDLPESFSDIAVTTGSGSTTGGIALGLHLSSLEARLHGFCVCNHPEYFYRFIDEHIIGEVATPADDAPKSSDLVNISNVAGLGYAKSTADELRTIHQVARCSGVVLDPVYTGKGVGGFLRKMREEPGSFKGRDVLFWHTGGIYGVFDKADQFAEILDPSDVKLVPPER